MKYILRKQYWTKGCLELDDLSVYQLVNTLPAPQSPTAGGVYGTVVPPLIEDHWFQCVTVISLRVINSNPKSIILILHHHLSNLNTLNYLEASDYKDKKALQLGKLMVCIKRKAASFFPSVRKGALKWTIIYTKTFTLSIKYPKFRKNLSPSHNFIVVSFF